VKSRRSRFGDVIVGQGNAQFKQQLHGLQDSNIVAGTACTVPHLLLLLLFEVCQTPSDVDVRVVTAVQLTYDSITG
jgi:hypothetical protein